MLNPAVEVYAPWRDPAFLQRFGGRSEMIDFCDERGLPITATHDAPYSTDANLLGLTHEAGQLESLKTPAEFIEPGMGVHPKDAPTKLSILQSPSPVGCPLKSTEVPSLPFKHYLKPTELVDRMRSVSVSTLSKTDL